MRRVILLMIVVVAVISLTFAGFQFAQIQDLNGPGARAKDFVKGGLWGEIHFEIDYFATIQDEIVPNRAEVDRFLAFVTRYTGKATSVEYQEMPFNLSTTGHWDAKELYDLSLKVRGSYSAPFGVLSVHIIYANALFEPPAQGTAGISITATTIVVFKGLFAVAKPDAEDSVLSHEFGHLLGLCGISMPDPKNICDGKGHTKAPESLMAELIDIRSTWVQKLELMPDEVALLAGL